MNEHLELLVNRASQELDFEYATENGSDTYFLIFNSWDDREKFVGMCRGYYNDEDLAEYEIEKNLNCELVFDDEYTTCNDCYHIIRTSPTHYGWQPDYYMGDGFIVCGECFRNEEDYQEAYLEERINNPKNAVNGLITEENLEELGFKKLNIETYESGLHYGQTDNPQEIYNKIEGIWDEVVFNISSIGQFDIHFDVWVRG